MPTLDVPEARVLVDYFADPNGSRWHWRGLLRSLAQSDGGDAGFRRRPTTGEGRDSRILCDQRDGDGRPFLLFSLVLSLVREAAYEFWPIQGPRAAKEYLSAIRQLAAGGFLEFHADWVKASGVGEKSSAAREHKFLLDLLRLLDYAGLESLVESAVDGSRAAIVPKLTQWLGGSHKSEAFVLKQMRLWSEEQAASKKRTGDK
jgi:hypothetical protein